MYPAVVVYDRPSGVTVADKSKAVADAAKFATVSGVLHGQVTGPIPSADGKAIETIVPVDLGSKGWNVAAPAAGSLRAIASAGADGLAVHIAGPLAPLPTRATPSRASTARCCSPRSPSSSSSC